jgi:hypothetical protein
MTLFEKRKNDAPRGWRLLVIGFMLGVVVMPPANIFFIQNS